MPARYFSGRYKEYFQGWYFKQSVKGRNIAFIPGYAADGGRLSSAFIQVVTDKSGYFIEYPISQFSAERGKLHIRIGKSEFYEGGMKLDIDAFGIRVKGELSFAAFNPPLQRPFMPNIMGPFDYLPRLECRHYIYSLHHEVNGVIKINGEDVIFNGGRGYCEGDRGRSFPKNYFWAQSNLFAGTDSCISLAAADVPIMGAEFCGVAAIFKYKGKERRFATYNGTKITVFEDRGDSVGITLKKGAETLSAEVALPHGSDLRAPKNGSMALMIKEALSAPLYLKVTDGGKTVFDERGIIASAENVGKVRCKTSEPVKTGVAARR